MSAFNNTLESIFDTKKSQLTDNAVKFDRIISELKEKLKHISSPIDKLEAIMDIGKTIPKWESTNISTSCWRPDYVTEIHNRIGLTRYGNDPDDDFSKSSLEYFLQNLEQEENKYKYANLFFKIFEEEMNAQKSADDVKTGNLKIHPRKEMMEQIGDFEKYAFGADEVSEEAVTKYLTELFKDSREHLDIFRETMTTKCNSLFSESQQTAKSISTDDIKASIKAYIKDGTLTNDDAKLLKTFLQNQDVLVEIRDVLNMKLSALDSFSWDHQKGITVSVSRHLNGKYRILMRPELLDGVFLAYIGLQWCSTFESATKRFYRSTAWKRPEVTLTRKEILFRKFFFKENLEFKNEINARFYRKTIVSQRAQDQNLYFMTQLGNITKTGSGGYDSDSPSTGTTEDPQTLKSKILLTLIAELKLSQALKRDHVAIRTDYNWFGPSLSHTAIFAVLKFFGFTQVWIDFFKTFLQTPMVLEYPQIDDDSTNTGSVKTVRKEIQVRQRGVPISFFLSAFFGEAILFCQDYNVNQVSDGRFLYRMHDDIWFWDPSKQICETTWTAMEKFNSIFGLTFKPEKTGSVWIPYKDGNKGDTEATEESIDKPEDTTKILPDGKIAWGLLELNSEGVFTIDQSQIDKHITELQFQLSATPSLLSWSRAYNRYISRYLVKALGSPSYSLGFEHIRDILKTLDKINKAMFPNHNGSITNYLRDEIAKRFIEKPDNANTHVPTLASTSDIPEGWFYLPISLGGLGIENTSWFFASILVQEDDRKRKLKENGGKEPKEYFEKCREENREEFKLLKQKREEKFDSLTLEELNFMKTFNSEQANDERWFPDFHSYLNTESAEYVLGNWEVEYTKLTNSQSLDIYRQNWNFEGLRDDSLQLRSVSESIYATKNPYSGNGGTLFQMRARVDSFTIGSIHGTKMLNTWGTFRPFWEVCLPIGLISLWQKEKSVWA